MIKAFKEITDWDYPNHSYALNDDGKCVAYRKTGTKEWHTFKKPLSFSKSRRKFISLKNFDPAVDLKSSI